MQRESHPSSTDDTPPASSSSRPSFTPPESPSPDPANYVLSDTPSCQNTPPAISETPSPHHQLAHPTGQPSHPQHPSADNHIPYTPSSLTVLPDCNLKSLRNESSSDISLTHANIANIVDTFASISSEHSYSVFADLPNVDHLHPTHQARHQNLSLHSDPDHISHAHVNVPVAHVISDTAVHADTGAYPKADTDPDIDTDIDADADVEADFEADIEADFGVDVDTDADARADSRGDSRDEVDDDGDDDADSFEMEVDSMIAAIEETASRRGDIPPIGVRVPIEQMPEIDNPLEKDGRNTVIRGRYPTEHPFSSAARNLGYKLVSMKYADRFLSTDNHRSELERMKLFFLDCNDVYRFLKGKNIKVPVIGGAPLNIFKLQEEVLLLGGLQNVVEKRAFRIVAQQLELPATCTSAAYVLKGTYERFLYHYEQLLVFGRWPANANESVNMKHVVTETREKERRALRSSVLRLKRMRSADGESAVGSSLAEVTPSKRRRVRSTNAAESVPEGPPPEGVSEASAVVLKEFMASSSGNATATWNFYCHLTGQEGGEFSLPRWALELPSDDAYEALIRAAVNVEKRVQARSKAEIVMLAVVECLETDDGANDAFRSLGIARLICCFSSNVRNGRKAQSVLFSLLMKLTCALKPVILADNSSGEGLLDGIFAIMHNFDQKFLKEGAIQSSMRLAPDVEGIKQETAACFCALRILAGLARSERNHGVIVSHRFFMPLCHSLLRAVKFPRLHLLMLTEVLKRCDGFVCAVGETGVFRTVVNTVISRLEQACSLSKNAMPLPGSHLKIGSYDYDISENLLSFLTTYSASVANGGSSGEGYDQETSEEDCLIVRFVSVIGQLLKTPHAVFQMDAVMTICFNLVGKVSGIVMADENFVDGLFGVMKDAKCIDLAVASIQTLISAHSLHTFLDDFKRMCSVCDDGTSITGGTATKESAKEEELEVDAKDCEGSEPADGSESETDDETGEAGATKDMVLVSNADDEDKGENEGDTHEGDSCGHILDKKEVAGNEGSENKYEKSDVRNSSSGPADFDEMLVILEDVPLDEMVCEQEQGVKKTDDAKADIEEQD